jgi:uncharacterized protein DUF6069
MNSTRRLTAAGPATSNRTRGRRAATIAAATIGALLVWVIADPLADVDLTAGSGESLRRIGPAAVVTAAVVAGLAATAPAVLLSRSASRPYRIWLIITVPALIVSLVGPAGAGSGAAVLALAAMHVVVGGILILGLGSTLSPEPDRTGAGPESGEDR